MAVHICCVDCGSLSGRNPCVKRWKTRECKMRAFLRTRDLHPRPGRLSNRAKPWRKRPRFSMSSSETWQMVTWQDATAKMRVCVSPRSTRTPKTSPPRHRWTDAAKSFSSSDSVRGSAAFQNRVAQRAAMGEAAEARGAPPGPRTHRSSPQRVGPASSPPPAPPFGSTRGLAAPHPPPAARSAGVSTQRPTRSERKPALCPTCS